eukprot:TRINITY_DN2618_c0_g1_i2.p1 TRINITY_DN2618_c0_g1~~TRINITY_DN2618_c0_g1_i2.p1  ORF type:complete len:143 (+),score=4.63 TRINITY_DN2618_c0_g1_i2:48-476(+)
MYFQKPLGSLLVTALLLVSLLLDGCQFPWSAPDYDADAKKYCRTCCQQEKYVDNGWCGGVANHPLPAEGEARDACLHYCDNNCSGCGYATCCIGASRKAAAAVKASSSSSNVSASSLVDLYTDMTMNKRPNWLRRLHVQDAI